MNYRKYFLFFVLLFFGFAWRYFLASYAQAGLFWDMLGYDSYAKEFLAGRFAYNCCSKNVGYGAFLALVYFIFGTDNFTGFILVQSIIDIISAVLIYKTALNVFGKKAAVFSLVIYIFNPLTSSFAGMRLPEVVSIFFMSLMIYIVSKETFKSKKIYWFFLGGLLGLLVFTRMQMLNFSIGILLIYAILLFRRINRIHFIIFFILGFLITSSYSLYVNYSKYHVASVTPFYLSMYPNLYFNFYNDLRYPEIIIDYLKVNPEFRKLSARYLWSMENDSKELRESNKTYKILFWKKLVTDWPIFVKNTVRNMVWLWDKEHLYTYKDKFYPQDKVVIRIWNILILFLSSAAIAYRIVRKRMKILSEPVILFTLVLLIFITAGISLVSNESRHTLFSYSVIILWSGYGLEQLIILCQNIKFAPSNKATKGKYEIS